MPKKRQLDTTKKITRYFFAPPFYGVPLLVWLYAFGCVFYYWHASGPLTGHLIGFDDHVRMIQVLNLVNGAGWYDRTLMRVNGPEGFHTIWPRIVDLPIALVVIIAQQFVSQKTAALIASVVVPYGELALLFVVATYFARPLVGKNYARLMALFLMFTTVMNYKNYTFAGFHAGEASHHSWYVILNLLLFAAATRVALNVQGWAPRLIAGIAIALSLAVGIESFPIIAGTAAIFAFLAWVYNDPGLAKRGSTSIGYGALLSLILLPLNQPPSHLFDVSFAEPSILGPILVGAAALYLALEAWIIERLKQKPTVICVALLALAGIFAALLVAAFPQILQGAGAALSPDERAMASVMHPEAQPAYRSTTVPLELIGLMMPIIIGWGAGLFALRSTTNRRRRILYFCYFGYAVLAGGMAQIFYRYYHHTLTTCCAWLLWAWLRIRQKLIPDSTYILKATLAFVALGPLWMLFLPAIESSIPFVPGVLLFPAKVLGPWDACDIRGIAPYVNEHYGAETNIAVPADDSAKFLYHTNLHIDFLANYPSQDKFIDNMRFFATQSSDVAKDIAKRHHIDLVSVCFHPLLGLDEIKSRPTREPMLIERLVEGHPPLWLKPIEENINGGYLLYQVDKSEMDDR